MSRTLTKHSELDALEEGTVIRDDHGFIYEHRGGNWGGEGGTYWLTIGEPRPYNTEEIALPATILHAPGEWGGDSLLYIDRDNDTFVVHRSAVAGDIAILSQQWDTDAQHVTFYVEDAEQIVKLIRTAARQ